MKGRGDLFLLLILIFVISFNLISAKMVQSEKGVYYDDNIFKEFENSTNIEIIATLKYSRDISTFVLDYSNIDNIAEDKVYMKINLDTFNSLINDERVGMIINKNAFDEENADAKVEYDKELIWQFLTNKWVHVTAEVKDFSNITIDYKRDSIETQTIKDNQKWDIYRNTSEAILSRLSGEEFQLESKSELGTSFSGNITKEGFNKLLKDERVRKIYAKKTGHIASADFSKYNLIYFFEIFFLIILIILSIKLCKKWKLKKLKH